MAKTVIADTSCLIVLSNIDRLEILKSLYSHIIITPEIKAEFGGELPNWIAVSSEKREQKALRLELDKGEASAIGLGLVYDHVLILIDEKKGRKVARQLTLPVMGTLGVLIKAKEKGYITSLATEIEKLKQVEFRMSEKLIQKILKNYD
jgi:predicted nucleic acid-binding protein